MAYPGMIYWKWDDSHVKLQNYKEKMDDIIARSCFDTIYITTHWCHEGITNDKIHEMVADACHYIHSKGRKLVFEIDPRAEKAVFVKRFPDRRTAFLYTQEIILDGNGQGECKFNIVDGSGGELFLGNRQSGESLVRVYCFDKTTEHSYEPDSLLDITGLASLERISKDYVLVKVGESAGNSKKTAFLMVAVWYDFNDLFSEENEQFFEELLLKYSDIKLDGVALDEMGLPWHPEYNFTYQTYMIWDQSPYYSYSMEKLFYKKYGEDYLTNLLHMRYHPDHDTGEQARAINLYHEFIRNQVIEVESYFYNRVKDLFGASAFVGVHPTWFAIEETDNTSEIWKNGIDWWDVPRDYGFTDEIMLYPVRLALTHKWKSNIFYNMWYSEATNKVETFFEETWRNARFGGRTITLGYECTNERGVVIELKNQGLLEQVSRMEEKIGLLNRFQTAPANSDILVVMGIHASCNVLCNRNALNGWDHYKGVFTESFSLARDIWNAGYNCDLVGSYEIEDGDIRVLEDGKVQYGNQIYKYIIIAFPEFSKQEMLDFIQACIARQTNLSIIGSMKTDFFGRDVQQSFNESLSKVDYYAIRPQAVDLIHQFERKGIQTNRVPYGCILQDQSVIITAPAPDKAIGNTLKVDFIHQGQHIEAEASDLFAIKLNLQGDIEKLCAVGLKSLKINDVVKIRNEFPEDTLIV